jgi:acetolactate synthase-1/3 small subunit
MFANGTEIKRRVLGLFVEDEPGVLGRITGLLLRRGFNIDTIIVGKTAQKGVSHIVISINADNATLEQLEKQVYKIIEVVRVVDLTSNSILREHCMVKINSNTKNSQDIVNFAKLADANVLEMNKNSIILEIVSEPEKITDFIETLKPFGIKELSRTGINAMSK